MSVIPGSGLGTVSIGETRSDLIAQGFVFDQVRDHDHYLRKSLILVRLENNQAVQIWYDGNIRNLRLRGKKFPAKTDSKTLASFFRGCEPGVRGSGGVLIYCENRGIELNYSFPKRFDGISILVPNALAMQTHCRSREQILFSCKMSKKKILSLCASNDLSRDTGYLQYRFGKAGKIELEYPNELKNSQKAFQFSRYTRPGTTYLRLKFTNQRTTYSIFSESTDDGGDGKPVETSGILVSTSRLECKGKPFRKGLASLEAVVPNLDPAEAAASP